MMEVISYPETSVNILTTRLYIPEDNIYGYLCEHLRSYS
jgi:hypothetical protein